MPRTREPFGRRLAVLGVIGLVVVLVLGAVPLGPVPTARATGTGSSFVSLMATDSLSFAPSTISAPTLRVEIEVQNLGTTDHSFTLSDRVNATAPAGTNASTNASGSWFDAAHVAADLSLPHGHTIFVNVTLPTPGSYQFICRIHFPSMVGVLTVAMPASSSSSGTPIYLYAGAVIGLVAVVVVAVVLARRPKAPAPPPK
ncbi:MAG: cupredoxin domain-containing protein [Thermoplasmata archaeon]|nr:cupredoxin domain-containing protein [Thermoplasmata archaeon]